MKIFVVTNMYPTEDNIFYGSFVHEQVKSLKKRGTHVDVYFINGREKRRNYFTCIGNLAKALAIVPYDIIHAHHTYCVFPIRAAKAITRKRIPIVLTFHEGEVHSPNKGAYAETKLIKRLVLSKKPKISALKMVDFVITVQKELLGELNFKGKSAVIPCGVDVDLFKPRNQEFCRDRLNLPQDKRIIFFPASPENKQKGFDILKEAVDRLGRDDVLLLAAGNIRHVDMPFYMNAADVVAQLSVFEASPSVVKEAMAANVPLVFTDSGDAKRMMQGVQGCFLSERSVESVSQALKKVLNFKGNCGGRERILSGKISLEDVSRRIVDVYKRVTGIRGQV